MNHTAFLPADILLPQNVDMTKFSVVACDQYTSEPDYWQAVRTLVKDSPSTLHMIFPEADFKTADFDQTIYSINHTMTQYLEKDIFKTYHNSLIYVERVLRNGMLRRGLVGRIDLEAYDYSSGSHSAVRATEGTVLERLPPRVKIRRKAPLELPHVMLLVDDPEQSVIEPLSFKRDVFRKLYDFDLMQQSGHLTGWLLDEKTQESVIHKLHTFGDPEVFYNRYKIKGAPVLQYAVGDGNHSLATAKRCYQDLKKRIGETAAMSHPARYALVELVNLHDASLSFEAIHRVLFGVSPEHVCSALFKKYEFSDHAMPNSQKIDLVKGNDTKTVYLLNPTKNLAVGSLQEFLDSYVAENGGEVDYIHGENVVRSLSDQKDAIGFLLESLKKADLFPTVIVDGALPRKTFSMGEACDKRFYCEARKIR